MERLKRVSQENGCWQELTLAWEKECGEFQENFEEYAVASMPVLEPLATGTQMTQAGVYAFAPNGRYQAICQANSSFLPGYTGKVLRIRHIVFSPMFDYSDEIDIQTYGNTLVGVFSGVILMSYEDMPAQHIKFHLRSPAEMEFGEQFTKVLKEHEEFKNAFTNVNMKGAWIYLSKA